MKKILGVFLAAVTLLAACKDDKQTEKQHKNDKVLVKYNGAELYLSEVSDAIPDNISPEDSAIRAESYINQWISNQVLLQAAQEYLADEMDDINKKVEDFRTSLMLHTFKEKLISQKLDTNITADDVLQYYDLHRENFILQQPAIRGFYVIVPNDCDSLSELKSMLQRLNTQQMRNIESIVKGCNGKFEDFTSKWKYFSDVMVQIPYAINDVEFFLKNRRYVQTSDQKKFYYLRITDYRLSGDIMPLELCNSHIRRILLNRKSEHLLRELEKTLYNQAIEQGKLKIYN